MELESWSVTFIVASELLCHSRGGNGSQKQKERLQGSYSLTRMLASSKEISVCWEANRQPLCSVFHVCCLQL